MNVYIASHSGRGNSTTPIELTYIECVVVAIDEKSALLHLQNSYNKTSIDDWQIDCKVDTTRPIHYNIIYE